MERILVIEDSKEFQLSIEAVLSDRYDVTIVGSGLEAQKYLQDDFDLIVLDVTLPDTDGFALFRLARANGWIDQTPVVFLTGRDSMEDRVKGIRLGAEEYLIKPFEPLEFIARIDSRIRKSRMSRVGSEHVRRGPFHFNLPAQRASIVVDKQVRAITLTPIEFRILVHLATNPDHVISRARLVDVASGSEIHVLERTIDKHMCSLRRKIEPYGSVLATVFGEGYRFSLSNLLKEVAISS